MSPSNASLHEPFSLVLRDPNSVELIPSLPSPNLSSRQATGTDADTQYQNTTDGYLSRDSCAVDGHQGHGLGITQAIARNDYTSTSTSRLVDETEKIDPLDRIRSSTPRSGGMQSPYPPRKQLGRKSSRPVVGVSAKEPSNEQDSPRSSPFSPYASTEHGLLSPHQRSPSHPGLHNPDCQTDRAIVEGRWSWLSVSLMLLALYSTIVSGIYLGIALARPRYGRAVGTDDHISSSTASLLSTLFAKTVELSFVTVFVAFLGQVLSRRAFLAKVRGGGVSIAEMMMRTWIVQPGTLITNLAAVRYAAMSFLGFIAMTAAVLAMFYVTAAEALVSPKLRLGPWEDKTLHGKVATSFANKTHMGESCSTPITLQMDEEERGNTCLQILHAGQAYHNYNLYLQQWTETVAKGKAIGKEYTERPAPIGVMFDNTTIQGQWITRSGETVRTQSDGRIVQNVTMAMPHANVFNAARDPANSILQPDELNQGEGTYDIRASVPAPAVNILCANVEEEDIESLIYNEWPTSNSTFNSTTWRTASNMLQYPAYPNGTAIDDLFGFGSGMGDQRQRAPIFPKLPKPYNTLVNGTGYWPDHALYLLAASPPNMTDPKYVFCSLKARQYQGCTTRYHAAKAGGEMSVHCDDDDPQNTVPYKQPDPPASPDEEAPRAWDWEPDWKNVASEWGNALALGQGITDGAASNARLLSQLVIESTQTPSLNPSLPSIGEALAVLAGSTLELSSLHSPFIHYRKYTKDIDLGDKPRYETFQASVQYQDYASRATQDWQFIFYIVLFGVFLTSCFCLIYLLWSIRGDGQITDYTEPQNLFALAVNSPPSRSLSGACGAGPDGDMLAKKWEVQMQQPTHGSRGHPHFFVQCREDDDGGPQPFRSVLKHKSKLSTTSVDDFEVAQSPAVEQYNRLISKRNTFF